MTGRKPNKSVKPFDMKKAEPSIPPQELASAPSGLYVGTSGWAYKAWQPAFFPEKLPQKKFLHYYASQLPAVEVNYTFRRLLTEKMIDNWLAEVPENFRFTLKANRWITHYRRLREADESIERFLSAIAPLANARRLGPVLFQLPPTMKVDLEALNHVLSVLPRTLRSAWEFRHKTWFSDETYRVLENHGAALCVVDREEGMDPLAQTAPFNYFRFRRESYNDEQKANVAKIVQDLLANGREVFAFFKHEESPDSALNAVEFLNRFRGTDRTRVAITA